MRGVSSKKVKSKETIDDDVSEDSNKEVDATETQGDVKKKRQNHKAKASVAADKDGKPHRKRQTKKVCICMWIFVCIRESKP